MPKGLLEDFLRQVSATQGQLPAPLAQSLQTLLRQIPAVLLQGGQTTVAAQTLDDAPVELMWLQRLLVPLLKLEPSLRQAWPLPNKNPLPSDTNSNQMMQSTLSNDSVLAQLLRQQPGLGRALLQWTLQLLAQHPRLMEQLTPQEQQQFRQQTKTAPAAAKDGNPASPSPEKNADGLTARQLPSLLKATLPLLQPQATPSAKAPPQNVQTGQPQTALPQDAKAPQHQAPSETRASPYSVGLALPQGEALLHSVKRLLQAQGLTPASANLAPIAMASSTASTPQSGNKLTWDALLSLAGLLPEGEDSNWPKPAQADSNLSALPQLIRLLHSSSTLVLPRSLQTAMAQLTSDLQRPLDTPQQAEQWLRFMSAPLADNTLGQGLQRWLLQLLTQRLAQADAQQSSLQPSPAQTGETQLSHGLLHRLGTASLQLVEQRQASQQEPAVTNQPWLCPLPSTPQRAHEPVLTIHRGGHTEQEYHWLLSFYLEPEGVGPLQIKVRLQIPDIGIMVIAEQTEGIERVKQTLPQLESRFAELGLQSTGFHCRQGKVKPPQVVNPPTNDGLSIHI
ncbi:hypothetical protein GCM10023095_11740 [Pseudaeromonas paramecii]|uniref:Flagellar hook-length control protein-like C-terminal domain-containing protein n=1 Tax=Pseudaeromonas paramecii TaxID=2138166 RepID=A0ABP8Q3X4_9GAMM